MYRVNSHLLFALNVLSMYNLRYSITQRFFRQNSKEPQEPPKSNRHMRTKFAKSSFISFENCRYDDNQGEVCRSNYDYLFANFASISGFLNRHLHFDLMLRAVLKLNMSEKSKSRNFLRSIFDIHQPRTNKVAGQVNDWLKPKLGFFQGFYSDLLELVESIVALHRLHQTRPFFSLLLPDNSVYPFQEVTLTEDGQELLHLLCKNKVSKTSIKRIVSQIKERGKCERDLFLLGNYEQVYFYAQPLLKPVFEFWSERMPVLIAEFNEQTLDNSLVPNLKYLCSHSRVSKQSVNTWDYTYLQHSEDSLKQSHCLSAQKDSIFSKFSDKRMSNFFRTHKRRYSRRPHNKSLLLWD